MSEWDLMGEKIRSHRAAMALWRRSPLCPMGCGRSVVVNGQVCLKCGTEAYKEQIKGLGDNTAALRFNPSPEYKEWVRGLIRELSTPRTIKIIGKNQVSKFKSGEYWQTRGGDKAFIASVGLPNPFGKFKALFPVCGYIEGDDEDDHTWGEDGNYFRADEDEESDLDLIKPWVEPRRIKGWVNVYAAYGNGQDINAPAYGVGRVYKTKKECEQLRGPYSIACIEIDVLEGEGLK